MIRSTQNAHIRTIRSLRDDRSLRHRERMFVLEGVRLVTELIQSRLAVTTVVYDPDVLANTSAGQVLLRLIVDQPYSLPASAEVIKSASDTTTPQGVLAVAPWPHLPTGREGVHVICDEIQDPGNMGTIIRSCDAIGVAGIWCTRGCVDVYAPKTVRASMGSLLRVPMWVDQDWQSITQATAHTRRYAADATQHSIDYCTVDWCAPSTLIIGNEARGLSQSARTLADQFVMIPMRAGIESLNAAMAATVILFEAQRQLRTQS